MSEAFNFKNPDELIHSCANKIFLESDVVFDDGKEYMGGIMRDVDNPIIDGNGHCIDACGCTCIFKVCAKNIIIKNIIFKNVNFKCNGAAICILEGSSLVIINVEFKAKTSFYGTAIFNEASIEIEDSGFNNNRSKRGETIANESVITVNAVMYEKKIYMKANISGGM